MHARRGRCGKYMFDEIGAKFVFADMTRRNKDPERIYNDCEFCGPGVWHVTSQRKNGELLGDDIPPDVACSNLLLIASTHHLTEGAA